MSDTKPKPKLKVYDPYVLSRYDVNLYPALAEQLQEAVELIDAMRHCPRCGAITIPSQTLRLVRECAKGCGTLSSDDDHTPPIVTFWPIERYNK